LIDGLCRDPGAFAATGPRPLERATADPEALVAVTLAPRRKRRNRSTGVAARRSRTERQHSKDADKGNLYDQQPAPPSHDVLLPVRAGMETPDP
jgi:hypothetical protein